MSRPWYLTTRHEAISHEDLFIGRYDLLLSWALKLTGRDRESAEDLVHDAFIQFTLGRTDLQEIQNLEGYLYGLLRNLHLSRARRAARHSALSLSLLDYDSMEIGLRAVDPRAQIQSRDELRAICRYACLRKETSKAGSVLILRFFHGYYPSEIAQILRSPVRAVADWLLLARREARLYLTDPQRLSFLSETPASETAPQICSAANGDLAHELRQTIFQSCHEQCLPKDQLEELYHSPTSEALDSALLGSIVSCPRCLDAVNRLLGLPLLSERHPNDMLGPDTRSKGGKSGGSSGGGETGDHQRGLLRRMKESFEHHPQELQCSVNGFVLSTLKVVAEINEHTLNVNLDERIGFVEIFSEQGIRLLYCAVEPPPNGEVEQTAQVELSEGRLLSVGISFDSAWPNLRLFYHDPQFTEARVEDSSRLEEDPSTAPVEARREEATKASFWRLCWNKVQQSAFWLRPGTVMVIVSALLLAGLMMMKMRVEPVSAAALLNQAIGAEESAAGDLERAIHRTIQLEERRVSDGAILSSRHIETWQSRAGKVVARRLFDERGQLIAGEWRNDQGSRTLYRRGAKPSPLPAMDARSDPMPGFDGVWLRELSARNFTALIGQPSLATVEETATDYVIRYEREAGASGLIKASLVLDRADLRARSQTLVVRQGDEIREYRFTERGFERRPNNTVAPAVFEPEPDLLGRAGMTNDRDAVLKTDSAFQPAVPLPSIKASAELEVEVLQRLNQVNALSGEQINLKRTAEGTLLVQGIVDTEQRKDEIGQALKTFGANPAVRIEVHTIAEMQKLRAAPSTRPAAIQHVEVPLGAIPVELELRGFFAKRGLTNEQVEREIQQFAHRMFHRSTQARARALALKQIAERFAPAELQAMEPQALAKWRAMANEQALAFQREAEALRRDLEPVFPAAAEPAAGENGIVSDDEVARAAKRLFDLATANDAAIRRSFSVSTDQPSIAPVKSVSFWRSLKNAENLAARIAGERQ